MIKILVLIFSVASFAANEPMFIKNQQGGAKEKIRDFQSPNNLATKLGTEQFLVETGNNNILSNPSFEHSTFSTSWTNSAGTFTQEASVLISGKASAKLVLSAQTMSLTQSSTLYAAQFADGIQGIATVRIKSNVALKVCSIQAGTVSTSNCVDVPSDNKWGLFKVPFILGATSNGISIASSGGAVSGTVYIDDAFVGVTDIAQVSSAIGPWTTFTPTGLFTNTTYTGKWRQVGENIEVQVKGTLTGVPAGGLTIDIPSGFTIDTTKLANSVFTSQLGRGSANDLSASAYYTFHVGYNGVTSVFMGYQAAITGQIVSSSPSAPFTWASGDTFSLDFSVPVTQFSNATSVYSSPVTINADKIGEIIQTTNSTAPQGFISALNKSIGQTGSGATYTGQAYYVLYEHLWSIAGLTTTAGDVYRISSAKGASASADFAANKTITIDYETNAPFIRGKASAAGVGAYTADTFQGHRHLIRGGGTGFTALGDNGLAAGSTVISSGGALGVVLDPNTDGTNGTPRTGTETKPKNVSLNIFIRFAGDTQLITGQFNGLQTCTDTLACTDTFSASIDSSGNVSQENVNWLNGNCGTATSGVNTDYTCGYITSLVTQPMNCVTVDSSSNTSPNATRVFASSSTQFQASNLIGRGIRVICQKQGADYIGKTAMAVASDQNVRSIGSTGVDIQGVIFGSGANCATACSTGTCTICNQTGSKITSVTWSATGVYNVNGLDGTKYICTGAGRGTSYVPIFTSRQSGTSSLVKINAGSVTGLFNAADGTIICIGIP